MPRTDSPQLERGVTLDQLFTVLSHPTRRRILTALGERDPHDWHDVESVAAEPGSGGCTPDEVQLYHKHLPRLDNARLVAWDRETDTVATGSRFEEVRPVLSLFADHQDDLPGGWP